MIGALLSTDDLERVASLGKGPSHSSPPRPTLSAKTSTPDYGVSPLPIFAAIYAGCDALREWADVADGLPEPPWYAVASVVGACRDGRAIFHALSEQDERYSAAETDKKLDQAISASGPRLCASIQDLGGKCDDCPFAGTLRSPISLGYVEDPAIVELARRWVYVAAQDGFIELPMEAAA